MIPIILAMAKAIGVPGSLLLAICTTESNLRNVVVINDGNSPTYGICQVKNDTAKMLGFKGKPEDLLDPKVNAKYAAKYLRYQLERYDHNWCKATAAFNSGSYNPISKDIDWPRNLGYVARVAKLLKKPDMCSKKVALNETN